MSNLKLRQKLVKLHDSGTSNALNSHIMVLQVFTKSTLAACLVCTCYPSFLSEGNWLILEQTRVLTIVLHLDRHAAVTAHRQSPTSLSLCSVWLAATLTGLLYLLSGSSEFRKRSEGLIPTSWLCFLPWWLACILDAHLRSLSVSAIHEQQNYISRGQSTTMRTDMFCGAKGLKKKNRLPHPVFRTLKNMDFMMLRITSQSSHIPLWQINLNGTS